MVLWGGKDDKGDKGDKVARIAAALESADAVVVGAGAGLSTAAGLTYAGERFERHFADFRERYGFTDMYSAGFYPFPTEEERWAYWSRHIWYNRYVPAPKDTYLRLLSLLRGRDYFVVTTNVDHQFQRAGIDKRRLFYTQGDYGLFQCSEPCHQETYDNYEVVRRMMEEQRGMRVPSDLVPRCPHCGRPMTVNLRADDTFVEDAGWHEASRHYAEFLAAHERGRVLYLELGVGYNTPGIIKYPFWRRVAANPEATYASVALGGAYAPRELAGQSILVDADIHEVLLGLTGEKDPGEQDSGEQDPGEKDPVAGE